MEQLRKLAADAGAWLGRVRAQAEAWFGRLTQRERVMVSVAGAAVLAFVVLMVVTRISMATTASQRRIEEKTRVLSQVGQLAEGYRRAQAERHALEARLKAQNVPIMTHVSQTGQALGVEVGDLRPSGSPEDADGITAESVEVSLPRIDPAKLGRFLQALEGGQGVVRVRRIRVATRSDDPKVVDATVVVSNYALKG
ncbi:MAG TPA: type II secretion system protein GspM [Anaeromyxobacteraceae bacterium]|nr:type II secretion system protein GspM [Anaeromyxobacteraceae bacterium]